jgi:hypothetical protein
VIPVLIRKKSPRAERRRSVPAVRRYATAVLAREVLRDAAEVLAASRIAVMPLKGVLFQQLLYRDPADRVLTDVDVLVPEADFERAIGSLIAAGFAPRTAGRSLVEVALQSPRGMTLDLHRRLFGLGRYKLSTEAVFRRATTDERLLGVPLQIAHPHDTAAHLIGKFVSDHESKEPMERLTELALWANYCHINPRRLAPHLCACGMARAARYVLGRGVELTGDPFFSDTLRALPLDRLGGLWALGARVLFAPLSQSPLATVPAHLLNASVPRGGASLALAAVQRLRHGWLERRGGAGGGYGAPFFAKPHG